MRNGTTHRSVEGDIAREISSMHRLTAPEPPREAREFETYGIVRDPESSVTFRLGERCVSMTHETKLTLTKIPLELQREYNIRESERVTYRYLGDHEPVFSLDAY